MAKGDVHSTDTATAKAPGILLASSIARLSMRFTAMNPARILLLAMVLLVRPALAQPAAAVQMFPEDGLLQPGGTVEFRFPSPMVAPTDLGPAAEPPVVFDPQLPGRFTWLSTRSGTFEPEGEPGLGQSWRVRLRDGLKTAKGKPAGRAFKARLTTPDFGVTAVSNGVWNVENVSPEVEVKLAFNLAVKPDAAAFRFVNAAGVEIPAEVRAATTDDYFQVPAAGGDWEQRWKLARDPAAQPPADGEIPSRLVIKPATLLPASPGWKLVTSADIASQDGRHRLPAGYEVALGAVAPFTVKTVEPANYINSGPTLHLGFSESLAPDITAETAGNFFSITPEPEGLTWEVEYDTVAARGKFALDRDYTLTFGPDVCSSIGQPFDGPRERTVRFGPVPPRLYLPELTMAQILGGRRLMPVRSVNLGSLRVKAVALDADAAVRALPLFREHEWKYYDDEPVPTEGLTGRVLCDETITLADPALDRAQTTDLDWTKLLGGRTAGTILLELQGEPLPGIATQTPAAQALVQLTDLGILWQKSALTLRIHVFSCETARPVAGAGARLLDDKLQPLADGTCDAQGDAVLEPSAMPTWLVVAAGGDQCMIPVGVAAQALRMGDWYGANWVADNAGMRAALFTDRPLYQPGETAHLKGLVRRVAVEGLAFAADQPVTLVLRNPRYDEVERLGATTDAQGSFDLDFTVPDGPLGEYRLTLEDSTGSSRGSATFVVAEYQPDSFEVDLSGPDTAAAGAPPPRFDLSGRYFFGGKVTDAEVRWSLLYSRTSFDPEGFGAFRFLSGEDEQSQQLMLRGDGVIRGGQPLAIEPALPSPALAPWRGVLTAEVTDINQQTVSAEAQFRREASDFYLGIATPAVQVVQLGTEVPLKVVAVSPDGQPLAEPVAIRVNIERWRNNVVRVQGAGGAMTFRRDRIVEPVMDEEAKTIVPVQDRGEWQAGDAVSLAVKAGALGHHQVKVTARDTGGREVVSETSFYVAGEGDFVWDYRNPQEITLVPDKTSYQPGETARILVQTPIDGEAFVSIDRDDTVVRTMRLPLRGNAPVIEVPLAAGDAPNFHVSLVLLRGADASKRKFPMPEFRYGSCSLAVEQPAARLAVKVDVEKPDVRPGDDVVSTVAVTDHRGRPVAGAGVTFYAVDDGVLQLTGFKRPDPADVFLAPVPDRVLTGLSLADLLPEDPEDLKFSNKGYLIGGGGEGGPVALRENFPGTACWLPSLVTDATGKVTARFAAPDALTRYRLVAVAFAGPLASGSGESSVKISRPLMLLPSLGAFANVGDQLMARAVIRNETGKDGAVEVTLDSPAGPQKQTLDVPQGASRAADFPLTFGASGTARLEWSATMQAGGTTFADRVRTLLPVGSPMLRLRETYLTRLDQKSNDLLSGVNPQLSEGRGEVAVTLANTRLAGLGDRARFLADYPYGCAEQTVSGLVPWVVMPALGPLLPGFAKDPAEAEAVITDVVTRILEFQTGDGGLAFWPGGRRSSPFVSAWAGVVLARAAKQGAEMPGAWSSLLEYLAKSLRGLDEARPAAEPGDRALAAYALALAGRPEASYHEELYKRRADLSTESRCLLALAIMEAGGPKEMVTTLLRADKAAPPDDSPFGGAERDLAIRLLAWTKHQPKNDEVGRLVAELVAFGPSNTGGTTQTCAWTLLALADYRAREQQDAGSGAAQGSLVSGESVVPFEIDASNPAVRQTFPLAPGPADTVLRAENPSAATLYAETTFDVEPPLGEQPAQDRGFAVSRSYRKIASDGSLQPAEDLRVGDRVVVTVRVETLKPAMFVAINDPLPSILEAVNPAFVSRASGEEAAAANGSYIVSHRETRSDRVLYFCDVMRAGAFNFQYLARVRAAGEATAAATKVEAMYRPERFGLGTIARLVSQAATTP
jgi:uncharacterized protein YfaS (alpha-2-macroglobulin family)